MEAIMPHARVAPSQCRGDPGRAGREMHRHLEHFELLMEEVFERGMTNRIPEFLRDPAGR